MNDIHRIALFGRNVYIMYVVDLMKDCSIAAEVITETDFVGLHDMRSYRSERPKNIQLANQICNKISLISGLRILAKVITSEIPALTIE